MKKRIGWIFNLTQYLSQMISKQKRYELSICQISYLAIFILRRFCSPPEPTEELRKQKTLIEPRRNAFDETLSVFERPSAGSTSGRSITALMVSLKR